MGSRGGGGLTPASHPLLGLRIALVASLAPLLARLKLSTLSALVEPGAVRTRDEPADVDELVAHVEWVLRRGRPLVRPGCLTRGLTLYYFLRRAGVDVRLAFGVGRVDEAIAGHCWLVKDERPFLERTDPLRTFTEVTSIPQGRRRAGSATGRARAASG
ncbi:MAG: lasso peptide biosynthesis B2 protein [Gaiellaceae bacterium]